MPSCDTAAALLDVLERGLHASQSEWLFLRELRVGTGHRNNGAQRLDAFALNTLPHTAMKRICYEVKTSRGDFLCELKHPVMSENSIALKTRVLWGRVRRTFCQR